MSTLFNLPALSVTDFNRLAGNQSLPFLITGKLDDPADLRPEHLEFVSDTYEELFVEDGRFTEIFRKAYMTLVELNRRESVALALGESRTVRVVKDLSGVDESEKEMVRHLKVVAGKIDELFMKQKGSYKYIAQIEKDREEDPMAHRLFWRHLGPWASSRSVVDSRFVNSLPDLPKQNPGIYPLGHELNAAYSAEKEKAPDLGGQWSVVVKDDTGKLKAVRYFEHYKTEMRAIADELDLAAKAIAECSDEKAMHEYLTAAASAFRDGDWDAADRKWIAMSMKNSKYALRVAPDETYWDPANEKAGFEFWFARIDINAAEFSKKLEPHLQLMEDKFHELVPAYPAREIEFELPDFIEMLLRGGDHKAPSGAVIGQKLPNFSEDGSRMVVMTNYGNDATSVQYAKEKAKLLLVDDIASGYQPEQLISSTSTLLHEMTHSFGVRGPTFQVRNPDGSLKQTESGETTSTQKALGGANAQVMEELKAQTGAVYWVGWLLEKGVIDESMAKRVYTESILWAFGHISRGMWEADGSPKTYSQLAGIQIRHFLNTGAMTVEDGKFRIHYDKMHASATELFRKVIEIQVYGDADGAKELRLDVADGEGAKVIRMDHVKELYSKYPRPSYELEVSGV